jgi:starvation-inducible DNA-binding protein
MHVTSISIPEKNRIELIRLLNISLASTNDLYAQLKQAHWNLKGMEFIALHLLFDQIAEEIEGQVDIIAERIAALGGTALGTIQETAKSSVLRPYPIDICLAKDHLERLIHSCAILGEHARNNVTRAEGFEDPGTSDLYIVLSRLLDKRLWFLQAHLQK